MSTGTRIDERYVIRQLLGRGATSEVYRACDELMKREVAIKLYQSSSGNWSGTEMRDFLKEAKLASGLHHANLAAIFAVGVNDHRPFLVMELTEGKTLATHLASEGALAVDQAISVMAQVCSAADYLHKNKIVHRDIKPANIVLSRENGELRAKLIDLGLAKQQRMTMQVDGQQVMQTASTNLSGTPCYMSPEQICGDRVDARSDVFAIGATLYEAVTNKRAFTGDEPVSQMMAALKDEPESIASACPNLLIPGALDNVIFKALQKDPSERFATAGELQQMLILINQCLIEGKPLPVVERSKPSSYRSISSAPRSHSYKRLNLPLFATSAILISALCTTAFLKHFDTTEKRTALASQINLNNPFATHQQKQDALAYFQKLAFERWESTLAPANAAEVVRLAIEYQKHADQNSFQTVQVILRKTMCEAKFLSPDEYVDMMKCYGQALIANQSSPTMPDDLGNIILLADRMDGMFTSNCAGQFLGAAIPILDAKGQQGRAAAYAERLLNTQQLIAYGTEGLTSEDQLVPNRALSLAMAKLNVAHAAAGCNKKEQAQTVLDQAIASIRRLYATDCDRRLLCAALLDCITVQKVLDPHASLEGLFTEASRLAVDRNLKDRLVSLETTFGVHPDNK